MSDEIRKRKELEELIFKAEADQQLPSAKQEIFEAIENAEIAKHEWHAERIRTVALELMNGLSPNQIWQKYGEQWNVGYDMIRQSYVKDARRFLADNILTEENDIRVDLLAKYNYLFQLNMLNKDFKEARAVLDSVTKLTQTITSTVTVLGNINTVQLVEVLNDELKDAEELGNSDTSDE